MSNIRYTYATNSNHDGLNYNLGDRYMYACDSQRPDFQNFTAQIYKTFSKMANAQWQQLYSSILNLVSLVHHIGCHMYSNAHFVMLYGPILGPI